MAQVSRYPVSSEVEKRMYQILIDTISNLRDPGEIESFLNEFISPVEKIMLAKRMAIAVLLAKGYDYASIKKILRVTPTTIASISIALKYSKRGYKGAVEKILRSEKMEEFWQKVDNVVHDLVPPGPGNWSYMRARREAEKRERKKLF